MPGGRPRKPTALALLHGDHRKNPGRVNRAEPVPSAGAVGPPYELSGAAQLVWDRLAPDRSVKGLLTSWDVDAFAAFCEALAALQRLWPGTPGYRDAVAVCTSIGGRFGWTPSDRAKLTVGEGRRDATEDLLSG